MKDANADQVREEQTAARRYLDALEYGRAFGDGERDAKRDRSHSNTRGTAQPASLDAWMSMDTEHADAIARCDAVMALTPKLAASADVGWAFEEAKRLAKTPPQARTQPLTQTLTQPLAWYRSPSLAWVIASLAAASTAVLAVLTWLGQPAPPVTPTAPPVTSITIAPVVVPSRLEEIRRLADIEPVVRIANQMTVDGRSIVVLPFSVGSANDSGADVVQSIYLDLVRHLANIPGVYVIEPSMAAAWTGTDFSPEQIASFLGVRGVVQGNVTEVDGAVTVEIQLTDAARDGLVFNETYERPTREVSLIRNDITSGLLDALTGSQPATY